MDLVSIVPDKPINKLVVENLWRLQIRNMIIHKFFLNRAIETLTMGVHLGSLGVGMVMNQMQAPQFFVKILHKFAAIVR